ncbi:PA0069 family radical SAM protein [Starkeya sp. ORNL1]|uniref:PA0069 family radical SAM protein n=1 Tax=Starkeya sp. ORNL1 TaxID=2709380 RepID=UPI0014641FE6|nr:PA0069 family radical SAM protein [Starkeya sp. ORNL1]QJP14915.1 PA0069 family radical SAM protein [Starkeya sp. ORNL1]
MEQTPPSAPGRAAKAQAPQPPRKPERIVGRLREERRLKQEQERAAAARDLTGISDIGVADGPAPGVDGERRRGRGAVSNAAGRFEPHAREAFDDGWESLDELPVFQTSVTVEKPRTIINRNNSPDVGFDRSINPYRGCEHGCVYCFARPTHAYQGYSAGLDFETKLFAKPDAPELLAKELSKPGYEPRTIALGINTDGYQPIEREWRLTRRILEVLRDFGHPVGIVTKSALVLRDLDILGPMAERGLAKVALSVTTLDHKLARIMEPRAATPMRRIETIRRLSEAGVPTAVLAAPMIPAINDAELERILDTAAAAGATEAGYVMIRLPLEILDLFKEWLLTHFPDRYRHVLSLVKEMHGGKEYDSTFGQRMSGSGPYAWTVARRFEIAAERLGLNKRHLRLTNRHFRRPPRPGEQLSLFGEER